VRLALVHGFTQTGRSWTPIAGRLREAGHDVVTPDVPGHGGREAAAMWDAADALAAEVGRAVWVGYSLGGRLGLHVALAHPEVIDGLVLVSTTAGIEDPAERERRRQADESLAATIGPLGVAAFVERWLDGPLWATLPRESAGVDARLANTAEGLAASLRLAGTGAQDSLWERLAEVPPPALVVNGSLDARFVAIGERLASGLGAARVVVPGSGHAVPWEQPAAFCAALLEWLTTSQGAAPR
jgi:2-succinyl-6-hydroxy-2,4-cyclohexadiene-1-carboxylate synthase